MSVPQQLKHLPVQNCESCLRKILQIFKTLIVWHLVVVVSYFSLFQIFYSTDPE